MKRNYDIRWQAPTALGNCIAEQRVVVVGGTGGLGRVLALQLASLGARVTVIGRTFRDADTPGITFLPADLSLMSEARRVAALLPAETLDMLIFSAGLFAAPQRQHTTEGIEHDLAFGFLSRLVMLRALVPRLGKRARARPRIFVLGYPGAGASGQIGDLNAEHTHLTLAPRQHAVAGNEMLVLDSASQYPQAVFFGLHPGRIKTDRLRHGGLRARLAAWLRGGTGHSADDYARHITPLLFSRDIAQYNGAMFNNKGQAILPSEGLSKEHIHQFMAAASALIGRTSKDVHHEQSI